MSLRNVSWAKEVRHEDVPHLSMSHKALLMVLADYANATSGEAWPSVKRLARECWGSESSVRRLLGDLVDAGLIERRVRFRPDGSQTSSVYRLLVPGFVPDPEFDGEPTAPVDEPTPEPAATVDSVPTLGTKELAAGLVGPEGVLDGYLWHLTVGEAYQQALTAATDLGTEFADLSADVTGYLRNAVVMRCAADTHNITPGTAARLNKEARLLGTDGHRWVVTALLNTASADIKGNPASYVIKVARNLAADAKTMKESTQ